MPPTAVSALEAPAILVAQSPQGLLVVPRLGDIDGNAQDLTEVAVAVDDRLQVGVEITTRASGVHAAHLLARQRTLDLPAHPGGGEELKGAATHHVQGAGVDHVHAGLRYRRDQPPGVEAEDHHRDESQDRRE